MAMKLTTENVNILETKMLDDIAFWEEQGEGAEKALMYIAGIHDMANAVRRMIRELGGC